MPGSQTPSWPIGALSAGTCTTRSQRMMPPMYLRPGRLVSWCRQDGGLTSSSRLPSCSASMWPLQGLASTSTSMRGSEFRMPSCLRPPYSRARPASTSSASSSPGTSQMSSIRREPSVSRGGATAHCGLRSTPVSSWRTSIGPAISEIGTSSTWRLHGAFRSMKASTRFLLAAVQAAFGTRTRRVVASAAGARVRSRRCRHRARSRSSETGGQMHCASALPRQLLRQHLRLPADSWQRRRQWGTPPGIGRILASRGGHGLPTGSISVCCSVAAAPCNRICSRTSAGCLWSAWAACWASALLSWPAWRGHSCCSASQDGGGARHSKQGAARWGGAAALGDSGRCRPGGRPTAAFVVRCKVWRAGPSGL
mmetsp:Transcript_61978/g.134337  ORF Transcript_61978/g.134337 Transcript_61978/m.134337 type:complete len:367 (-) Transcript_61978:1388-2488(-)